MTNLIKQLVAFKKSTDRHRVIYSIPIGYQSIQWSFMHQGPSHTFVDLIDHVTSVVQDRARLVTYDIAGYDPWEYIFTFDALSGEDAAMLKLMAPVEYKVVAYPYKKPERYPGEYCGNHNTVVHSGFQKHKLKGLK